MNHRTENNLPYRHPTVGTCTAISFLFITQLARVTAEKCSAKTQVDVPLQNIRLTRALLVFFSKQF
jgi:hypothetical protein